MPSISATTLRESLRLFQPLATHMPVNATRASQDALGALGARLLGVERVSEHVVMGDFPACMIHMPDYDQNDPRCVLYLHGGAYVAGGLYYARGFGGMLARALGLRVYCVAYRLAPENPYPAALEDARAAYEYLLGSGYRADQITLVGESAGGGLCLALCLKLKAEGAALPARCAVLSPWVNLMCTGASYTYNQKDDPTLSRAQLFDCARMYAGDSLAEPLVSPLMGDLRGLPPTMVVAGGDEILLSDSVSLQEALVKANVPSSLHVEKGMWHAYPLYGVPESREAIAHIAQFVLGGELSAESWGEDLA